jgi:quercetin dioxygenase-like cupin family protein
MIITRWQAPIVPNKAQLSIMLESEGLEPFEEVFEPHKKVAEHRKPFAEVRIVAEGEMLFNISGNQFILRPGDRLEIPGNTKHSFSVQGQASCTCICGLRAI